jgi:hypothetical protein
LLTAPRRHRQLEEQQRTLAVEEKRKRAEIQQMARRKTGGGGGGGELEARRPEDPAEGLRSRARPPQRLRSRALAQATKPVALTHR